LRHESPEIDRRLDEFVQLANAAGGTYHRLDFGHGTVLIGEYDLAKYLPAYHLPGDLQGKSVLDIGTATGYFALECARRGAKVTAVDLSGEPLLASLLPLLKADVTYVQKNIYDLDSGWGQFDLVLCGSLLLHLPDLFGAVQRIRSVCKGEAIVSTACGRDSQTNTRAVCEFRGEKASDGAYWHYWDVGAAALNAMLLAAGFSKVKNTAHFTLTSEPGRTNHVVRHVVTTGVLSK
jgi:2-polyprenyl-3-methyl-5-hydroxy-6-metoxy-1,4-benzoquinol methylase